MSAKMLSPNLTAALDALHFGWSVFPVHYVRPDGACSCGNRDPDHKIAKHPRTKHGVHDASNDPQVVMDWWQKRGWANSNLGLACGEGAGVWVLDEDVDPPVDKEGNATGLSGVEALREYERIHGALPETMCSRTGGGGRHFFFRYPKGRNIRNHVALLGPDGRLCSLDVRANGGYVLLPPSSHESGTPYRWIRMAWPPADAPAWLLDLVDPPEQAEQQERRRNAGSGYTTNPGGFPVTATAKDDEERYALRALEHACARVGTLGEGSHRRNMDLCREAFTLGGFVGAGCLQEFKAREDLIAAGTAAGLSEREARDVVVRGLRDGALKPTPPQLRPREDWIQEHGGRATPPPAPSDDEGYYDSLDDIAPPADAGLETAEGGDGAGRGVDEAGPAIYAPASSALLPAICASKRQGSVIISEAWRAVLARNNPPRLFLQAGRLVGIRRSERGAVVRQLLPVDVQSDLLRAARWIKYRKANKDEPSKHGWVEEDMEHPPDFVAADMHAAPIDRLPVLDGLVFAPVYDATGKLLASPGYHASGRLSYETPAPFRRMDLTPDQARDIVLDEWLGDFPFALPSDRAHAIAMLLLPFVRRMVDGPTPAHLIEAPRPGSGKSLLARTLSIVSLGRHPEATPFSDNEEERRKALLTALAAGRPVVFIDNVKGRVDSPTIEGMLTATSWADRELGRIGEIVVPNYATWVITSNNADVSLDFARRSVRIRLDPQVERPEERTGFRIAEPLETWTVRNRNRLVSACLTLIDRWLEERDGKGYVYRGPCLGSFESWSQVLGGILEANGVEGFLRDRQTFREAVDTQGREWTAFVDAWAETLAQRSACAPEGLTIAELVSLADDTGLLMSQLGDGNEKSRQIRLSKLLHRQRDGVTGTWRVAMVPTRKKPLWALRPIA